MKLDRAAVVNVFRAGRFFASTRRRGVRARGYGLLRRGARVTVRPGGTLDVGPHLVMGEYSEISTGGQCTIGSNFFENSYSRIVAHDSITIGDNVLFGSFVSVLDHDHRVRVVDEGAGHSATDGENPSGGQRLVIEQQAFDTAPIVIGDNVWLGDKVTVVKGVTIGDNVVVGANSVVTRDLPSGVVAAGAPAKVVRHLFDT